MTCVWSRSLLSKLFYFDFSRLRYKQGNGHCFGSREVNHGVFWLGKRRINRSKFITVILKFHCTFELPARIFTVLFFILGFTSQRWNNERTQKKHRPTNRSISVELSVLLVHQTKPNSRNWQSSAAEALWKTVFWGKSYAIRKSVLCITEKKIPRLMMLRLNTLVFIHHIFYNVN